MASYGTPSAGVALTATTAADRIVNVGLSTAAITANTVIALDGNDLIYFGAQGRTAVASATYVQSGATEYSGDVTLVGSAGQTYTTGNRSGSGATISMAVTGVVTSERGLRTLASGYIGGNAGNDTIALGNTFTNLSATSLLGGAGDDVIGTYTNVTDATFTANAALATANGGIGTASTISKFFTEGGGGNDTVYFYLTGSTVTASTFQGGGGNDSITFNNTAGGVTNTVAIFGGGGNDIISGDFSAYSALTVAGGGGNDAITISAAVNAGAANLGSIYGDVAGSISQYDGDDTISAFFGAVSSTSIFAGGGNDVVTWNGTDQGNNYIGLAAGNDILRLTSQLSAATVEGGAGEDTIGISAGAVATLFKAGGDNDTFTLSGDAGTGTLTTSTIFGGLGADTISNANASISGGNTVGFTWAYSSYEDSVLSAMDTIAIGGAAASGTYVFRSEMGGAVAGSFSAEQATGTNGVVTFTATYGTDVTSRASYINANMTTVGSTVTFKDGNNVNYLFIQGGATDVVTQVGTAGTSVASTLNVAGAKTITLNLA